MVFNNNDFYLFFWKSHQIPHKSWKITSDSNPAWKVSMCHFKEIDFYAFWGPDMEKHVLECHFLTFFRFKRFILVHLRFILVHFGSFWFICGSFWFICCSFWFNVSHFKTIVFWRNWFCASTKNKTPFHVKLIEW